MQHRSLLSLSDHQLSLVMTAARALDVGGVTLTVTPLAGKTRPKMLKEIPDRLSPVANFLTWAVRIANRVAIASVPKPPSYILVKFELLFHGP